MTKFCSELDYTDIKAVQAAYPDAAEIVEADGGWQVFDSADDAETWKNQQ